MGLIDSKDVKEMLLGLDSLPWEEEVDGLIDRLPTVEAVPVVRGEWVDLVSIYTQVGMMDICLCTNCNTEIVIDSFGNFCPNCGADMRKKVE